MDEAPDYPQVVGQYGVGLTYWYQNLDGNPPTWTNAYSCYPGLRIPTQTMSQFSGTLLENSAETGHCRSIPREVSGTVYRDGLVSFFVQDISSGMGGCSIVGVPPAFRGAFRDEHLFASRRVSSSCAAGSTLSEYSGGGPVPNAVLYQELWGDRGPL